MVSLRDIRIAVRNLARTPGFSLVVVLTLALGIGSTTAIFSVVHSVVLKPLQYPAAERLVRVTSELRKYGANDTGVSVAELYDYQSRTDIFAAVAGVLPVSANVTSGGEPERVELLLTSWNYFAVLGVDPIHGRSFTAADQTAGVANLAVVSYAFWERRLGGDPFAVGRTIVVDEDPVQVIGVMPRTFRHPGRTLQADVDIWSPAGFGGAAAAAASRSRRRLEGVLARLQPAMTVEGAQSRLDAYGQAARLEHPADYPAEDGWSPRIVRLQDDLVGSVSSALFVLLSGVGLLLLVACVNVAHLVLARGTARSQEMAVRQALGASRSRLFGQLAVESAVLAAAGGALGVLVASWGLRALVALAPRRIPRVDEIAVDATALLIAGAVALAASVLFALVPALQMRRDLLSALKQGSRGTGDRAAARGRHVLVAVEVATATVLLVGAGLFVRTVMDLLAVPVGFETDRLLTARLTLPRPNDPSSAVYLDDARRAAVYGEIQRRVSEVSGVQSAALTSQVPLGGFNPPLFVEVESESGAAARPTVHHFQVSPEYFSTLGIPVLRGRGFTSADRRGAEEVAVVSETAARLFWPGRDPLGRRIRLGAGAPWYTIVGVAGDILHRRLTEAPQPLLYRPLAQSSDLSVGIVVRAWPGAEKTGDALTQAVRSVVSDVPLYSIRTMDDLLSGHVAQRRFMMRVLMLFGVLATGLALLGIYGVMAYAVSRRTREIGIRMAIGARQADVSRMFLARGLLLCASGIAAGIISSIVLTRFVESQLFGVQAADPAVLVLVIALMAIVAAAAAYVPARRAARVDPIVALRSE